MGVRPRFARGVRGEMGGRALGLAEAGGRAFGRGRLREVRVSEAGFSKNEMMIAASARTLVGVSNCFVGVGLPNIVCNLAQRTVNPDLQLVYESGVFGARPERLPLSIGDPTLVTGATAVTSMFELFAYYLQAGLIGVAFLGAAQIDRFGNINTTVIGDYAKPKVRLPGAGGAPEIASNAKEVWIIIKQTKRSFVPKVDFLTSVGHLDGGDSRSRSGARGAGPTAVITDLGILTPDPVTRELTLTAIHPGITVEQAKASTGWELKVAPELAKTAAPTAAELQTLRDLQ